MTMKVRALAPYAALAMVAFALCLTPFRSAAAAEKWDLYVYNAVSTVAAVKGLNTVIEQIEKETGGQLSVRLHLGGSLPINTTTITQAVSDDVVQMGDDGYFLGNVPIGGVLRLPMLIRTPEEYEKAAAIMTPYLEKAFAKKGVVVLGQYLYPSGRFFDQEARHPCGYQGAEDSRDIARTGRVHQTARRHTCDARRS